MVRVMSTEKNEIESAARVFRVQVQSVEVKGANDLEKAFQRWPKRAPMHLWG